jgi:Protein of unknown function (DUF2034)
VHGPRFRETRCAFNESEALLDTYNSPNICAGISVPDLGRPLMLRCGLRLRTSVNWLRPPFQFLARFNSANPIRTPRPTTENHHDLPSFLDYAQRTGLSSTSTTYVGTRYEYTVQHRLRQLGFSLSRIGGRDDSGIDLLGTWLLPSNPHPLRVIVQCKALKGKLGPNLIRELEGAFIGAPIGWRGEGVLGILVSPKSATKGVREAIGRSRWAMGWIMVENEDGTGRVRQMLWNRAAANIGLEGITVTMRYGESRDDADGGLQGECVLMWKERPIEGLPDGQGQKGEEGDVQ